MGQCPCRAQRHQLSRLALKGLESFFNGGETKKGGVIASLFRGLWDRLNQLSKVCFTSTSS